MSNFWEDALKTNNFAAEKKQNDFWGNSVQEVEQQELERLQNRQKYNVELSDEEYAQISGLIAGAENPDEEGHKIASAIVYSKQLGIPLNEAYSQLDTNNEALFNPQQITDYKNAFVAIKDMFVMGTNNVRIGQIGQQLKKARANGNKELEEALLAEYRALQEDNSTRYDNAPRKWVTEVLKDGAQSLPYTGYAAGAAMFGSFIAPIGGTLMAFGASSSLMAGQEYLDLIDKGVRPEIAEPVSNISGAMQGLVETALGEVMSWAGSGAHLLGQKVIGKELRSKLTDKIAESLQRKFHFGTGSKLATKLISDYILDLGEEGAEEFIQQEESENLTNYAVKKENQARKKDRQSAVELDRIAGLITDEVADAMIKAIEEQLPELEVTPQKEIFKDSLEAFKGGVMGAIALGIVPGAANGIATARDYKKVKDFVKETPSEAMVQEYLDKTESGQKVKESFTEEQQETLAADLVNEFASRNEAEEALRAKEKAEVTAGGEGYEQTEKVTDENGEETGEEISGSVYRNENGQLEIDNATVSDNGEITTKQYKAYDPTKEGSNLYGTIEADIDEKNNKITINKIEMAAHRSGLTNELFDSFARDYAGYDIEYNAVGKDALALKESLIAANPNGKNNGLNYYTLENINADFETRKKVAKQLKSVYSGNYSDEQLSQHVAFLESAFNSLKRNGDVEFNSFTDFINDTFQNGQVVQSAESNIARGGFTPKNLEKNLKAAIYVSQNGNFTTFTHEVSHLYRSMLQGEHLAEVSEAFGVQKDENGKYNWTRKDEERLAYGLEDYLATGKATNETQKKWYDKLCDFMAGALSALHNFVNFTPEIEKVYKDMLEGGNGNTLAAAYQAVKDLAAEEQKAVQAKKEAEEKEQKQKAQQEAAAQEKEERRENMDISEEQAAANEQDFPLDENEEAQIKSEKLADEIIQDEIKETLKNDGLTEEEAQEVADVLTDESATLAEKIETVVDATAESQEEETNLDEIFGKDGLFQIIGELGASNLDRMEEVTTRMDNLDIARDMEKAGKDAKAIRYATGWEKGADGKWRYETNDLLNRFDLLNKVLDFEKRNPKYKEYSEKLWKSYDGGPELTEAEIQEFDALADEANAYYDKKDVKLKDILDAPELYAAYPKLKDMDVKFVNDPLNTTKASYATGRDLWTDAEVDFIQINNIPNSINEKEYEGILLHELQHAIQRIEGFATGGSVQELVQNYKTKIHARMNEAYKEYYSNDELKKDYDEYKRLFNKVAEASNDDFMAAYDELFKFEDSHENVRNFNKQLEQARKDLHLENNMEAAPLFNGRITDTYYDREYSEIVKKLAEDYYNLSALDDYKALAGEVEARNVQKRINMSPAERLETLLSDTEDVARDQQIVMFEAVRMAAEEEEQLEKTEAEKQIEDVRKQYEGTDKWMKAPNGEDTNLSEKQWLQVRTPNFLRWFGNWLYDSDKKVSVISIDTKKVSFDYKDAKSVSDWIKKNLQGKNVTIVDDHLNVYISGRGLKDSLKERGYEQRAAYVELEDIISNAVRYDYETTDNQPKHQFLRGQDVYYSAIELGGDYYSVKIKLDVNKQSQKAAYKGHVISEIKIAPIVYAAETASSVPPRVGASTYTLGQLTGNVNPNYSKILDENGEPLVVYHGSGKWFTEFNNGQQIQHSQAPANTIFTTSDRDIAMSFADYYGAKQRDVILDKDSPLHRRYDWGVYREGGIYSLFLNMKNPKTIDFNNKQWNDPELNINKETQKAIDEGYDGLIATNIIDVGFTDVIPPPTTDYIVFKNTDVKSATDNNGNFDENVESILYQTMDELYADARMYETWQEFMEAYTGELNPEALDDPNYHNQVPGDADAQWYQTTWEFAHDVKPEESLNEQEIKDKVAADGTIPAALDAMFTTAIASNEKMLDDFLIRVAEIENIDLGSDEYAHPQDEEEAAELQNIERLQDFIETQLNHGNWISNAKRVRRGDELTTTARKRIVTLIRNAPRDYRAIYAEIMGDNQWAVEEEDTVSKQLERRAKLAKYKAADPNSNFERMSPEKRRKIAEDMDNEDIARKVKDGSLHMDEELEQYIALLEKRKKAAEKRLETLEKETQEDYQKIADWQKKRLLQLYEKLVKAKSKLEVKTGEIADLVKKGIKISSKYQKDAQNLRADYNELFRKWSDLKEVVSIDAKLEEALKRQDAVSDQLSELYKTGKDIPLANEIKKMRIELVKRTMRCVPFNRIDYDTAKKIIAVQRIFYPNLLGDVNTFIGQDTPYLRAIVSRILTDSDYKEKIINDLKNREKIIDDYNSSLPEKKLPKSKVGLQKVIEKIENLNSIKQYDEWTPSEKAQITKFLPKENWIRELNLEQMEKEREESIDLEVDIVQKRKQAVDDKGKPIRDKEGNPVYEVVQKAEFSDEIGAMVKDAIGADLFDVIVHKPFIDWTTRDLEKLAIRVNELYTEGRNLLEAKRQAKKEAAAEIRKKIEEAARNTGIVINDDDTPEEKERKQKKIDKILGIDSTIKGTLNAGKQSRINRLLHGYVDANVRRVARILDNYSEGANTNELYWKENEAYNNKTRSINSRVVNINKVLKENNITLDELESKVKSDTAKLNGLFTVDELLYIVAADKDFMAKEGKEGSSLIDDNDDFAPTSRNAVMFGNMMSETENTALKASLTEEDKALIEAIENGTLTKEQEQELIIGQLDKHPGTSKYISACHAKYEVVLGFAQNFLNENPKYQALLDVISNDYASQYDRMNEISIQELNAPVHRTNCYVPLVRMESNGDTNENKVREDLLATMGGQTKQWVNKGMTARRVSMSPLNQKPVMMGLYKTWTDSVDRTEHFIAYAGYVRELNQVYKSRDAAYTRQFIENRYGKGMIKYIDEYINEVANPNANRIRSAADELMHTLRGKTAPAYLAWKVSSVMKQAATSPWPYMQFVNPVTYLSACFKCLKAGTYDMIREKSVFMNNRRFDPMADLVSELEDKASNKFERFMAKQSQIGMAGLEWIDWVAVAPGWLACYEKKNAELSNNMQQLYEQEKARLTKENMYAEYGTLSWKTKEQIEAAANEAAAKDVEKAAVDYADDCVRLCQPSNRSVDIAPLFKNNSEAWKAYLQFQTSLNVIWQNIRYDLPYAVRKKQFKQIVGIILGYTFAGIAMNSLMEGVTGGDDDDDNKAEATVRKQIYNATTQFTDSIPMIGSAVSAANQKIITGKGGYTTSGEDMTPMVTKFINVLTNSAKAISEADEEKRSKAWQKAASNFAQGVGMFLGLPTQGVKELGKVAGIGDGDGSLGIKLSEIADNELFNAIDEANPLNQE